MQRVLSTWKNSGSSLDQFADHGNPMQDLIDETKVDYRTGGVYTIKRVKSIETPNIYMDFHILIKSVENRADHQKLLQI